MSGLATAILYGTFAGLMIPAGGLLACIENIRPRWLENEFRHSVMAFGGGVLIAAVSLVLVPHGSAHLPAPLALAAFAIGGGGFALLDHRLRSGGSRAQFWAMLTDFIPEAMALGAMLATSSPGSGLLALLIGLQNLPEGFNAFREIRAAEKSRTGRTILFHFFLLGLLGPICGAIGFLLLAEIPETTAFIMMTAAGGILFLMFQDIAPRAHMKHRTAPSLAALAGFGFGLLGDMLLT